MRGLDLLRRYSLSVLFAAVGSSLLLFTIVVLFNMVFRQLVLRPEGLLEAVRDPTVIRSIGLTMYASLMATLIAVSLGTPLAYLLARHRFPGKSLAEALVDVPVVIPHSVAGIALYALFMRHGAVGRAFSRLGIVFEDSLWGVVVAMLFVSAPFYINAAREGFRGVDPRLERVARSLGAGQWTTFYRVTLPLSLRSLISGAVMSWARGISEFGAIIFLAYYPMVAPTLIYYRFTIHGLTGSQPVAVLLILLCLAIFLALRLYTRPRRGR